MALSSSTGEAAAIATFQLWSMRIKSLFSRGFLLATLCSAVAILVAGFFISNMYRKSVESHFQDLLRAELYHVVDTVTIADRGALFGNPQLADLRFVQPKTGWYWMVEPLGGYTASPLLSLSLAGSNLPVVSELDAPRNVNYERYYNVTDAFGNHVRVVEIEVVLATDGRAARFRVAGNSAEVEKDVRSFSSSVYLALIGCGVVSLVVYTLIGQTRREAL